MFGIEKSYCNKLEQVLLIAAAIQTVIFISVHCRCCCCACINENAYPNVDSLHAELRVVMQLGGQLGNQLPAYLDLAF